MAPKDIDELQGSLNQAAGSASVLWTTFVTLIVYLTIALGSVKHRDLFLETPMQLPLLNVKLPLTGFFVVAPTVVLLLHFYVLLQLQALANKAKYYDAALRGAVPSGEDRQVCRQKLDVFLILQFLAGPKDQREGSTGLFLRLITWLTLVGAPLLVLLLAQLTFLPYHNQWMLWWQRSLVVLDILLIWYFWSKIGLDTDAGAAPVTRRKLGLWAGGFLTLCVLIFSVVILTYPGEWVYDNTLYVRFIPKTWPPQTWPLLKYSWDAPHDSNNLGTLHDYLFAGQPDNVSGQPRSLLSDRLVLMDQSVVDDPDKLDKLEVSHSFRGRDLRYAALNRADLRKADFTGARLDPAYLPGAKLKDAKLGCASTSCTSLQGARLTKARLQGANLSRAQLQGANLSQAQLQGADLFGAQLQGASLSEANLQETDLAEAYLQGADLSGALLQGADLWGAFLQGAELPDAKLQGASLECASVWRIRGTPIIDKTNIRQPDRVTKPWDLRSSTFEEWRVGILKDIPPGVLHDRAEKRLSFLGDTAVQIAPNDLTNVEAFTKAWSARSEERLADRQATRRPLLGRVDLGNRSDEIERCKHRFGSFMLPWACGNGAASC